MLERHTTDPVDLNDGSGRTNKRDVLLPARLKAAALKLNQHVPEPVVIAALDRTVFYPLGGGQAGDTGLLVLADGSEIVIADTRKGKSEDGSFNDEIAHLPPSDVLRKLLNQERISGVRLAAGDTVTARTDWARRHACGQHRRDVCHLIAGHLQDLTPLLGGLMTQSRESC